MNGERLIRPGMAPGLIVRSAAKATLNVSLAIRNAFGRVIRERAPLAA